MYAIRSYYGNRIEAEILKIQAGYAPGMVPEIYLYDPVMCCVAMEDLSEYEIMRYALINYKTFDNRITSYNVCYTKLLRLSNK